MPRPDRGRRYRLLGTLGGKPPTLTCSYAAVARWGIAGRIVPYPTFEDAVGAMKEGRVDAVAVPAAYPSLPRMLMDPRLVVAACRILPVGPFVSAGRRVTPPQRVATVFFHTATAPLLASLAIPFDRAIEVASKTEAGARA